MPVGPSSSSTTGLAEVAPSSSLKADPHVPLRLTVTRGRLGLELYEPVDIGPLIVQKLALSFRDLHFPLDLSGGVPVFRNRRGHLEHVELTTDLGRLKRWIEPSLRRLVGALVRTPDLWWIDGGIGLGYARDDAAVACDVYWAPEFGTARFVVANARGVGLDGPALAEVLRTLEAALGKTFERSGRVFTLRNAGRELARRLLPAVGARAPSANEVVFGGVEALGDTARVLLDAGGVVADPAVNAYRALELARLVGVGDDALVRGEPDVARTAYLTALEQAPAHRELILLVAEIDRCIGDRTEAALGMITEAMPATTAGIVGGDLLIALGDRSGAARAYATFAQVERFGPLAALALLRQSECETETSVRHIVLDAATARAPSLHHVRWIRFADRAKRGDIHGAVADAQQLEATSKGQRERYAACLRVAQALFDAGFEPQAATWYQRAHRYLPNDALAMLGLARALVASGRKIRAVPLLEHAILLLSEARSPHGQALIELATLIAHVLTDLPQAIARLRQVSADDPAVAEARALEANYRLALGDIVGASTAFARMRECVELGCTWPGAVESLLSAARCELETLHDPSMAERHLAVALRLAPHDEQIRMAYGRAAAQLAVRHRQPV